MIRLETKMNFKALFFLFLLTSILFFATNCGKSKMVWVYYDETQCSDRWDYTNNNEVLKQNVVNYADTKGVTIYDLEIFSDKQAESCTSCECKTGRRFKCKIKQKDVKKIKAEGFYE